ncbi:MAG: hypothetical protein HQL34_06620 [Alphaproteobacteria bacterium]|nr:hypothetical protein [Alphaproteobacteria bacterium]
MTSIIGSDSSASSGAVFEKYVYDDPSNKVLQATDIGFLRRDYSRLNVMGKLDTGDKDDFYKMRVQTDGNLQLGFESDGAIRIQVLDLHSRVVADSMADMGDATTNFLAMQDGTYEATEGTLIIRVLRETPGTNTDVLNYNIQAKMGGREKDYVAWEVTPPEQKPQPVMSPIVGFLNSMTSAFSGLFR